MTKRILIIEDDKAMARLLSDNLEYEKFLVETCDSGRNALAFMAGKGQFSGRPTFVAQLDVDRKARKTVRRPDTRPSHDLADYAGDFDHPAYGRMTIRHGGDELKCAYRGISGPLAHRHYDTFELPEAPERLLRDLRQDAFVEYR